MNLAFIGFGEAARALVTGWQAAPPGPVAAYDIKQDSPETRPGIARAARQLAVSLPGDAAGALRAADLVFSTVTANQAVAVARDHAGHLRDGALWCDLNSCAPEAKRAAAAHVERAGGRYVDVAVMAPVHPGLNMVPCLLAGPHAAAAARLLADLPMSVRVVGDRVGHASAIKMVRSVMVKGLEALTAECVLAAVRAGVADEVIPSLARGEQGLDVAGRAAYNFERSLRHGERRAAEMQEVAATLADLGLPADMALATVNWQRRLAAARPDVANRADIAGGDWRAIAAAILATLPDR